MPRFLRKVHFTQIFLGLAAALLLCAASTLAHAQPPLVYTVENTGLGLYPAPVIPDFAHLPIQRQLPDPFVFFDGSRDTSWAAEEHHRQEWIAAIEASEQGPKPNCTGNPTYDSVLGATYTCSETASYTMTSANHYTVSMTVTVVGPTSATNSTPTTHTLTTTFAVVTPTASATFTPSTQAAAGTCGPVPANGWPIIMGMGSATGSWPATAFTTTTKAPAGVSVSPTGCAATVSFPYTAFAKYITNDSSHAADGFRQLYPTLCAGSTNPATAGSCTIAQGFSQNGSNSGDYAEWAYGMSRTLDALQDISSQTYCNNHAGACVSNTALPLDVTHSATSGCSYAGKMSMFTGAWDERVALMIAQENGGGGSPAWRISHEIESQGSVEDINDTDYDWFDTNQLHYSGYNVYKDPEDHFELMAMAAPRAMLTTGDSEYYWLGDRSETYDDLATAAIYNNYGIGDRYGYYIDTTHSHCAVPAYQQNATQATINRFLFGTTTGPNSPAIPQVSWILADALQPGAQPTIDPNRWTAWWGTGTPAFPAADVWNNGGDVELPLSQNLTLNTGDTITSQFQVTMPGTHGAATVSVPTSYTEIDVSCTDGTSYTFAVPPPLPSTSTSTPPSSGSPSAASNPQSFTIGANNNSVFPSAVASTTNPGCDNGHPGHVTGSYFYALGNPNPGAGNPGLTGFQTTDGVQGSGQTDPLNVTFTVSDSNTGKGGVWAPWTTINRLNPYSCDPWGCALTPTINWPQPAGITYGTPLSSTQLNATAWSSQINGMATAAGPACGSSTPLVNCTGLLVTGAVPGTWSYNPPAGTKLPLGTNWLTATFTPTALATDTGTTSSTVTNNTVYKTYTIATAKVPILVGSVSLTASGALSGSAGSGYTMTVTITNNGNVTAPDVILTVATLGSTSGAILPASLGDIAAGGWAQVTLTFPGSTGTDGSPVVEKLSGTYTGGTFGGSFRAVLP